MSHAHARGANFEGADLEGTVLDGADLTDASMGGAAITGASRTGVKMKVKVRVKAKGGETKTPEAPAQNAGQERAWIRALSEEEKRKQDRKVREAEKAVAEKKRLDRKLGRKEPLFNRAGKR
ncbi:MAG: pentapeptide repeat-containing protein [Spirochaetales bacterium]|nr:pentapeptide repeat-containing protein [Spirochaetales bacterium]